MTSRSSEGKVAEMGTVTPVELWGRKNTRLEGRYNAHLCWPGGTLETRGPSSITDPACPFSPWTSVRHPNGLCEVVLAALCRTCPLVRFGPQDMTVLSGTKKCLFSAWLWSHGDIESSLPQYPNIINPGAQPCYFQDRCKLEGGTQQGTRYFYFIPFR